MRRIRESENLRALLYYVVIIIVFYAPVLFGAKSLLPSLYQPGGTTEAGLYGVEGRTPVNSFNVDIATPAYYESPINWVVGGELKAGRAPLWNPYQGAGTPLAAQYSTRALFPYQMLQNISPVWAWDFFMLGRLLIAAFFTFLFLRRIKLGFVAAFIGGLFYAFSGSFVWFINLEQLVNVAMVVPLLFFALEGLAVKGRGRDLALSALAFALLLLAGQPETALYALFMGGAYFFLRLLTGPEKNGFFKGTLKISVAFLLGLMMAAPLILPFLELWSNAYHIHPAGGKMGLQSLVHPTRILPIFLPSATEIVQDPSMVKGLCPLINAGGGFFRYLPINGVWDSLGGYSAVAALLLSLGGVFSVFRPSKRGWMALSFFFFAFFLLIILKNMGVRPFLFLGHLPLFDQVWSLRWAGPLWCFALAIGAAIGMETLLPSEMGVAKKNGLSPGAFKLGINRFLEKNKQGPFVLAFLLIGAGYVIFSILPTIPLLLSRASVFNLRMEPFVLPSIGGALAVFLIMLLLGLLVIMKVVRTRSGYAALVVLAILELWWAVPRGYTPEWLVYKWILFGIGFVAALAYASEKWTIAGLITLIFIGAFFYIDLTAPRGMPPRSDPFASAPYVEFLKAREGHFRVAGSYGALLPNFAGVQKLQDIHYVNSLAIREFQEFRTNYLHADVIDEEPVSSLWFTGRPERCSLLAPGKRDLGRYRTWYRSVQDDFGSALMAYSLLGVRYFILPANVDMPSAFPLLFDGNEKVYENPYAFERAWFVSDVRIVSDYKEAQRLVVEGEVDALSTALVEQGGSGARRVASGRGEYGVEGTVSVISYSPQSVVLEVNSTGGGMVVLSDVWYPGWKAKVNGKSAEIVRVDGLIRGVYIDRGKETIVEFFYSPFSFTLGLILMLFAIGIAIVLALVSRDR